MYSNQHNDKLYPSLHSPSNLFRLLWHAGSGCTDGMHDSGQIYLSTGPGVALNVDCHLHVALRPPALLIEAGHALALARRSQPPALPWRLEEELLR